MSSSPPAETYEVDFARDEQWVVHDVVARRVDDAIDDRTTPPSWALEVVERIEADDEAFTYEQATQLHETMTSYVETAETPQTDVETGREVIDRLETLLEQVEEQ